MTTSQFAPVHRQNLAEQILNQLRTAITSGELTPGSALSEPILSRQLSVSRSPIREALIELGREGLIEFTDSGRARVCSLNDDDFSEIISMRAALEPLAARWAAERWTPELTLAMEESIRDQEAAPNLERLSLLDVEMHEQIIRASGHRRLLAAWRVIRPQFEMWLGRIHRFQNVLELQPRSVTVRAHRKLLAALCTGNPDEAERETLSHVRSWRLWMPNIPDSAGVAGDPEELVSRKEFPARQGSAE